MAKRIGQKAIIRELKRISEGIPAELLTGLMEKKKIAPTIKDLITQAIALPDGVHDMTPEKRQRFQNMIAAGVLDREVDVVNPTAEAAIAAYYEAEIALSVKIGRLPKNAPMPSFIRKKGIKYARKQRERLEGLYSAEGSAEEGAPDADRESAGGSSEEQRNGVVLQASGDADDRHEGDRGARDAG